MKDTIQHNGKIEQITNDVVYVRIIQQSACSGCHAKNMCGASESKEKIIEIPDRSGNYTINENVLICGKSSLGLQAVLLAFVIPVLLVLFIIILGHALNWDEGLSALAGILFLVPYYSILYAMRDKLKKRFTFTLKKLN